MGRRESNLIDFWLDLPCWLRIGFALSILAATGWAYSQGIIWPWGWAVGGTLLLLGLPGPLLPPPKH